MDSQTMPDKMVQEAVDYASGSNELENNILSKDELVKIMEDIQNGKTDASFLYSVVELVKKKEEEKSSEMTGDASYGLRKR